MGAITITAKVGGNDYDEGVALPNEEGVTITLETATNDANIHYTLDGSNPTSESTKYTAAFVVEANDTNGKTVVVKAVGIKAGYNNSAVASKNIVFGAVEVEEYTVTVTNGTGDGNYAEGATVAIVADASEADKVFDKWTSEDGVTFADENAETTSFTMLAKAVTVVATYKDAITKNTIDHIISGGITDVNNKIKSHGDYAVLGKLINNGDEGTVAVTISNGAIQVTNVYDHIVGVLIKALNDNSNKVNRIYTGDGTTNSIDLTGVTVDAQAIKEFVQASGLTGDGGGPISGSDNLSVLYTPTSQTLTAVVVDVNGEKYTYKVTFVGAK